MNLIEIGHVVGARRAELGLTQAQLAHLSGLSRQTLVGLENGTLSDLGVNRVGQVLAVLGLDSTQPDTQSRRKKRGLWMAAKTASVSYSRELAPETLEQALASGADGLEDIRTIVAQAPTHLRPGGWLLLEHGYDQAQAVKALLATHGFAQVQSRNDLAGIARCTGGQWPAAQTVK